MKSTLYSWVSLLNFNQKYRSPTTNKQLDTGSNCNVISLGDERQWKSPKFIGLTKQGTIMKVEEAASWNINMVAIGEFQLCIDSKNLNNMIKCPKHQMTTLEEQLLVLSKAWILTVLDVKDDFYQMTLTTFWTPFYSYQYLHMPCSISFTSRGYCRWHITETKKRVTAWSWCKLKPPSPPSSRRESEAQQENIQSEISHCLTQPRPN